MGIPLVPVLGIASKIIDKIFPNPADKAKAEALLQQAKINGELAEIETRLSAIVMEAQSQDKWTSRARPGFLYVIYIYILAALPFGIGFAFSPEIAGNVTEGVTAWLASIPDSMWGLFGAGYLGYTGARTWEKQKLIKGKN